MLKRRFKLRLSSFKSCRLKSPSDLPIIPIRSFSEPTPVNGQPPRLSSFSRHLSSALCGCHCRSSVTDLDDFAWQKDDSWHVIAKVGRNNFYREAAESPPRKKIYTSAVSGCDTDDDLVLTPPKKAVDNIKPERRRKKRNGAKLKLRISTSSADSDVLFCSSTQGEETEHLISSSFSDETSSLNNHDLSLPTIVPKKNINQKPKNRATEKQTKRQGLQGLIVAPRDSGTDSPARPSVFRRLVSCRVEGKKVRESLAVVKRSDDPYEDFKRSMMEMIVEKEMFDEKELQELLECFLSLNSERHYPAIVEAFSDVWKSLFCTNGSQAQC